jgi:transcriptional regulator with XRE-family HTH domain
VAVHLGVDVQTYGAFESGRSQIPAVALADLADLFKVPIFYFFQDMPLGIDEPATTQRIPAPVLTVATQAERVASLAEEFKKLGWQEQQYVLMFARALSRPAS